jgi:hypothetical protein
MRIKNRDGSTSISRQCGMRHGEGATRGKEAFQSGRIEHPAIVVELVCKLGRARQTPERLSLTFTAHAKVWLKWGFVDEMAKFLSTCKAIYEVQTNTGRLFERPIFRTSGCLSVIFQAVNYKVVANYKHIGTRAELRKLEQRIQMKHSACSRPRTTCTRQ